MRPEPQPLSAREEADLVSYVRAGLLVVLTHEEYEELSGWARLERMWRTPPRYPPASPAAGRLREQRKEWSGAEPPRPATTRAG
jgi:outer membrane PBP1 activator LpoA protein